MYETFLVSWTLHSKSYLCISILISYCVSKLDPTFYNYESNQQDAITQVNLLFLVRSTCFGRGFVHHQEHLVIYVYSFSLFGVYKLDIHESVHRDTIMKVTNKMQLYRLINIPSQLYMFRAMFSPIIRSAWIINAKQAKGIQIYNQVLLMMGENIARNM